MKIGITGTVGAGKSSVASILASALGCRHLDTDEICRKLLEHEQPGYQAVKKRWQNHFFDESGELDRKLLRNEVFLNHEVRSELEAILHPLVHQYVQQAMKVAEKNDENLLVEVPLLFEVGWQGEFDHVVSVFVNEKMSIERTAVRDNVSIEQTKKIVAAQLSADEKAKCADSVVDNSGIWSATVLQISYLASNLQALGLE